MPDVDIYILAIQEYIRYIYDADNTLSTSRFQLFDLYLVGIDTLDIYLFFKENNLLFVGPPTHPTFHLKYVAFCPSPINA